MFAALFRRVDAIARLCLIVAFLASLGTSAVAQDAPKIRLRLAQNSVYLGETAKLILEITGDALGEPKIDASALNDDFDVLGEPARSQSRRTSSFFGPNGRSVIEETTLAFTYELRPKRAGAIVVKCPKVEIDGKTIEPAPDVTLNARDYDVSDLVQIETIASPEDPIFPLVPIEITVRIDLKALPGKLEKTTSPLEAIVQNLDDAPTLDLPWHNSAAFNSKVASDQTDDEWVDAMSSTAYGFNFAAATTNPIDSFWIPFRKTYLLPKPTLITKTDANGVDATYWRYELKRVVRPVESGEIILQPATLRGRFIDFDDEGVPQTPSLCVAAKEVRVVVKDVPQDAPDDYVGVYGKIKFAADVSDAELAVGDAATLTLQMRGYGSFEQAVAPDLAKFPLIEKDFKTYPPTERLLDDGVAFDYQIRPRVPGKVKIPSLAVSYFDVEKGAFQRLNSDEIELDVRQGAENDDAIFDDESEQEETFSRDDENALKRIDRANKILRLLAVAAVAILALAALVALAKKLVRLSAKRLAESNARIADDAKNKLEIGIQRFAESPAEGFAIIRLAFLQLVSKRFKQRLDSVADAEFDAFLAKNFSKDRLGENARGLETAQKLREFFAAAERFKFARADVDPNFADDARDLMKRWIELLLAQSKKLAAFAEKVDPKESQ